jgi:hypothetical protein
MKVKEKAAICFKLWLHVNAGDEGMQAVYLLPVAIPRPKMSRRVQHRTLRSFSFVLAPS